MRPHAGLRKLEDEEGFGNTGPGSGRKGGRLVLHGSYGWWDDGEEPFKEQWDRLESGVREKRTRGSVWAAGDFNSPANVRGQGYDYVKSHGWKDTYETAGKRDEGLTVQTVIDAGESAGRTAECGLTISGVPAA